MSLRDCIARLEREGDPVRVRREVDRTCEFSAVTKKLDGKAVLFENVRGFSMAVVVGTEGAKDRIARNLGVKTRELVDHFARSSSTTPRCRPAACVRARRAVDGC